MTKTYSLSRDGETFVSPHFQVKEFKTQGDTVIIANALLNKLERLSDCLNNIHIRIRKAYSAFSVVISVNGYLPIQLAVLAEICAFEGIQIADSNSLIVDVVDKRERQNFINTCGWIHVHKFEKKRIKSMAFPEIRDTVKNYAKRFNDKGTYIFNGGFFGTYKHPVYMYKTHGEYVSKSNDHYYGIGVTADGDVKYGDVTKDNYIEFLSGHPVLADNYNQCNISYASELCGANPRTALGCDKDNVYVVQVDGRSNHAKGLTLFALRELITRLGIANAINIDGGGSTIGAEGGNILNSPTENRVISNAIVIKYL